MYFPRSVYSLFCTYFIGRWLRPSVFAQESQQLANSQVLKLHSPLMMPQSYGLVIILQIKYTNTNTYYTDKDKDKYIIQRQIHNTKTKTNTQYRLLANSVVFKLQLALRMPHHFIEPKSDHCLTLSVIDRSLVDVNDVTLLVLV